MAKEFLGVWEQIHNPNFKVVEFDHFKCLANASRMSLTRHK